MGQLAEHKVSSTIILSRTQLYGHKLQIILANTFAGCSGRKGDEPVNILKIIARVILEKLPGLSIYYL